MGLTAVAFVLFMLLADFDDRVLQVELAFLGAAACLEHVAVRALPERLRSHRSSGPSPAPSRTAPVSSAHGQQR